MKATLTELHRNTAKIVRPVINGGQTVELTEQGKVVAKIVPQRSPDPKRAVEILREMGKIAQIQIAPRK